MNAADNLRAFLTTIRACEGTLGPSGYSTLFGGTTFSGFADHPRKMIPFKQTDGTMAYSSAAGAYQFLGRTWDRLQTKLHLSDFSPANQDRAAIELIAEAGALADVKEGRIQSALEKCAPTWASLPASIYPQPKRSIAFACDQYCLAGGLIA